MRLPQRAVPSPHRLWAILSFTHPTDCPLCTRPHAGNSAGSPCQGQDSSRTQWNFQWDRTGPLSLGHPVRGQCDGTATFLLPSQSPCPWPPSPPPPPVASVSLPTRPASLHRVCLWKWGQSRNCWGFSAFPTRMLVHNSSLVPVSAPKPSCRSCPQPCGLGGRPPPQLP